MSETNGYVTREQWLQASPRKYRDVEIDGLGKVRIRTLSELERSRDVEGPNYTTKGKLNVERLADGRCRLIVAAVVDQDGNPLLSNIDVKHLRQKDSAVINKLAEAIGEHCGMSDADMEKIEKNSETPGGSSPSS